VDLEYFERQDNQ